DADFTGLLDCRLERGSPVAVFGFATALQTLGQAEQGRLELAELPGKALLVEGGSVLLGGERLLLRLRRGLWLRRRKDDQKSHGRDPKRNQYSADHEGAPDCGPGQWPPQQPVKPTHSPI